MFLFCSVNLCKKAMKIHIKKIVVSITGDLILFNFQKIQALSVECKQLYL